MKNYQHQPLRKPEGWTGQDAALVIQLERQLDDIYRKLGALKEKLGDTLTISEQELTAAQQAQVQENLALVPTTATNISTAGYVADARVVATLNGKINDLKTITRKQFTAIATGQTATYVSAVVDVSYSGYIPVSVGYTCGQSQVNVYACRFTGANEVTVGASNLTSQSVVTIMVIYIKEP